MHNVPLMSCRAVSLKPCSFAHMWSVSNSGDGFQMGLSEVRKN